MERMKKGEGMTPEKYIAMVEEENKNLRDYADNLDSENDNQAIEIEELKEENKKLKERINTMQEFIDYSGGVVQNAIQMLYEEGGAEKALDYLENCYVIGDDGLYEEMEKIYKDEN